ncbi:MAG: hypothetical protein CMJ48_09735 [Planctomycetaceae bacterium]|nr:hypothetical protein [Planctomycetaceae bacterium]
MIRLSLAFCIALGCTTTLPAAQPPGENLIRNPSLEQPALRNGLPFGWSGWPRNDTTYKREVVEGGKTGKKALKISGDGNHGVVFVAGVKLDRTKRYALKGWVKLEAEGDARAYIKFNYFHNYKNLGLTETVTVTPAQKGWQLLERTDHADEVPDASMLWISCLLAGKGTAWFDDLELVAYDRTDVAADFDAKHGRSNHPPEYQILNRRVGTWTTETTIKPGPRFPDGAKANGEETISWSMNKKALLGRGSSQPGNAESMSIWTHDPKYKVFRAWYFDSHGNQPRTSSTGTWDESKQTLTFRFTDLDGGTSVSRMKFVGNDEMHWSGVWKDKDGGIVMEIGGTSIRKKE